ncbi:MAG: 1-aminocyclopropane-1-carboxylate deaminase/D-cysteine desulfhydrase [Epsilonproteobacteria bacterium]|nr:1-aminocyclopropane-1-carboxylate deaminase/D-cysteine desulfhydrase [Campylobacterota bacterium]
MKLSSSPIDKITFRNHTFFVKRDDLLDKDFSGNKARKFYYYLINDFPHINKVVSYGSSQSNAMYSLSVLAKLKGWKFYYFVDHISSYLKENPHGNYKAALKNGMIIYENRKDLMNELIKRKDTIFIKEGGAMKEAEEGVKILAKEIIVWAKERGFEDMNLFLPSGTGTTALFLQKYLPFSVFTSATVGDKNYLKKQFFELEDEKYHPKILKLDKKYHFGKLYPEFYAIWRDLKRETGIEFDLLYDPKGWMTLLNYLNLLKDKPILYIHQGGLIGNESMKLRYERKLKEK